MENFPSGFVSGFLKLHNHYRAIHKSPPLQIDDKLSEYAQEWADILAKRGILAYRPETEYGENVYVSFWRDVPPDIKPKDPLEFWYREGRYFKYGEDQVQNLQNVRHFTQMIWKETKLMGLGMATGSNGKIYFVCNYDPPGNVDGKFAMNVSPLTQEGELLQHEEEGIRTIGTRMDVVQSMERLYAVPSEKLRVWSVWLTKVGEIADEWQRWLRSYIDLTIRLSDHLQASEDTIRRSKGGENKSKQSFSGKGSGRRTLDAVGDSAQGDQGEATTSISTTEKATDESKETDDATKEGETSEPPIKSTETAEETKDAGAPERDSEGLQAASKLTVTPDTEQNGLMMWPIGRPWQHSGLIDEIEEEEFEKLPMPRSEEEMRQLVQKFTQEATVFRSYYKHWSETADQAIKEIGGRLVMATYITQGKGEKEKKRLSLQSSRYFSALSGTIRSGLVSQAKSKSSVAQPADPATESSEQRSVKSAESDEFVTPEASKSDAPTVIENLPNSSSNGLSKKSSKVDPSTETLVVDDLVKDCARAAEPIPYFFYLKTEPDIGIAIEHDDEEVILADFDRENILGNYQRLFFNLTDKPCKGGKPWL